MDKFESDRPGKIIGTVRTQEPGNWPVKGARVTAERIDEKGEKGEPAGTAWTNAEGRFELDLPPAFYHVTCHAFGRHPYPGVVEAKEGHVREAHFTLIPLSITVSSSKDRENEPDYGHAVAGQPLTLRVEADYTHIQSVTLTAPWSVMQRGKYEFETLPENPGDYSIEAHIFGQDEGSRRPEIVAKTVLRVSPAPVRNIGGTVGVTLGRTTVEHTLDQALWSAIRNRTRAISFHAYRKFIQKVLCDERDLQRIDSAVLTREKNEFEVLDSDSPHQPVHGVGAFHLLKTATSAFLLLQCGVWLRKRTFNPDEDSARWGKAVKFDFIQSKLDDYLGGNGSHQLPYLKRVINAAFPEIQAESVFCDRVLTSGANCPCLLELIWSYWHEEGMLVQTMGAISRRFQNVRAPGDRDPLAHLEIDPLRPVNNLLWGYVQDEANLLSVKRRAYEYDHHYGLTLYGRAVPSTRPADSRSKFLEAFHNLLHLTSTFFKEDNDTTVIADGYPLLNALKEVHLLLAQGAHNQFGDLPWTARAEMLMQQWLLSRSEMRDFLQSRVMVPYKEGWMPQVDTMKTLQGWSDVTITHFSDLGVYGEQILLSIRYADWIGVNDEDSAKNWARYWRPEIQAYLHAYRAVTGIDLTNPDMVDSTMPAVHLQKRLALQTRGR